MRCGSKWGKDRTKAETRTKVAQNFKKRKMEAEQVAKEVAEKMKQKRLEELRAKDPAAAVRVWFSDALR